MTEQTMRQFDRVDYEKCKGQLWKYLVGFLSAFTELEKQEIKKAFDFAAEAHGTKCKKENPQKRKDEVYFKDGLANFYIVHPVIVAVTLAILGKSKELIIAALLHDVVEDTDVKQKEIVQKFKVLVARFVYFVTDEKVDFANKLLKILKSGPDAMALKIADRLNNLLFPKLNPDGTLSKNAIRTATETLLIHSQLAFGLGNKKLGNKLARIARKQLERAKREQKKTGFTIPEFKFIPIVTDNFTQWQTELANFCNQNSSLGRDEFLEKWKKIDLTKSQN